jgi:hypothetical protein
VVSVTDPFGRILGFLDRSRYFSIKFYQFLSVVLTRLSGPRSRPTTVLFFFFFSEKSGSAGNLTRASGSVAKNSDHSTTEAVQLPIKENKIYTSTQLCEILYTDSQDMLILVLSLTVTSRYFNFCTHSITSPENYGYLP